MHTVLDNMGMLVFFFKIILAFRFLNKLFNDYLLSKALFDVKVLLDLQNYLVSFMSSCFLELFFEKQITNSLKFGSYPL